MIRTNVGLKQSIILMPITEQEAKQYSLSFASVYLLYKDIVHGEIQIGIPDMQRYSVVAANMWNCTDESEKAYFYNGGSELALLATAGDITDRPVYNVVPTKERTVAEINILNDIDIELNEILSGSYIPVRKKEKEM